MLMLKPNCECCDRDLNPQSLEALICSYECTFCAECAEKVFGGICPNCGGGFVQRPVRPIAMLAKDPASQDRYLRSGRECEALRLS
jgi:hypothetical protein